FTAKVLNTVAVALRLSLTVAVLQQLFRLQWSKLNHRDSSTSGRVMKKFLVTAITLAALAGAPATAADPSRPVYKAPPPVFSWTGCYVGGNAGALLVHREFTDRLGGDPFFGQTFDLNTTNWIAGIQAGCNYQFAGGWVVGIQGDYDWSGHSSD